MGGFFLCFLGKIMIIVSACLAGINCRYDGDNNLNEKIYELFKQGQAVPVCPEQLGGLSTPRLKCEIVKGDGKDVLEADGLIINEAGEDVTPNFIKGAQETLKIAQVVNAKKAYLKENSPSCGVNHIKRKGNLINGIGVTAYLLKKEGVEIISI